MHRNSIITGNPISNFHNAGIFDIGHLQHADFQCLFSYKNALTFTGKEKDSETGFYYFGVRYYDPSISGLFLSVDPMADKYPNVSPYAYCAWNPVKMVDPDGKDAIENYDGWRVDKQNKTIYRVGLMGGDLTQYVEGDGEYIRHESRCDLYNEYKDYIVIDNIQGGVQLNPAEEKEKADAVSPWAIMGTLAGGGDAACTRMKKYVFEYENGTYMGKDGSQKIMKKGKNGGLNGRYKSQIAQSNNYGNLAKGLKWLGRGFTAVSIANTEMQAYRGEISTGERITSHAIDIVSLAPYCWHASFFYELGKKHGPSTWFH